VFRENLPRNEQIVILFITFALIVTVVALGYVFDSGKTVMFVERVKKTIDVEYKIYMRITPNRAGEFMATASAGGIHISRWDEFDVVEAAEELIRVKFSEFYPEEELIEIKRVFLEPHLGDIRFRIKTKKP
jgi:hypothetical protein